MRKVLFLFLAALLATTSLQAQPAVPEFAPLPYAFDALKPYITTPRPWKFTTA
ncbi:hypothetical protein MASR1M12_13560 [Erysipelotrichia bacterium]